jgi:hypothetical protein
MRQFSAVHFSGAIISALFLAFIAGCGGSKPVTPTASSITLNPAVLSLNEGQVLPVTAIARNFAGAIVTVDLTFTSSNTNLVTVSPAGLVCGGKFDANNIVCTPNGDGQATVTVTSGTATGTTTVYVHKQVDRVVINPVNDCSSMGTVLAPSALAYNTSAQGCSNASPCDITSTVGPFTYGSGNLDVAASAAGIASTYDSTTNTPTYSSGGIISGSAGQTCNLSDFSVGGGTGLDPTFDANKKTPTYVSGGTITGSTGQTCTLSNFNGLSNATATVTLTSTNGIATGSQLNVTSVGFGGGSTAPTTADLGNGTATCSGTASVNTALLTSVGVSPVVGATATVALTGANAIASGTKLSITNSGFGAVSPPTTATLSNGTATCSGTASVITALNAATGLVAQSPGATVLTASVAGVTSVGTPFTVCPVVSINIHDANSSNTNFSLAGGQTQNLIADVLDTHGQSIKPNLLWDSSQPGSIKVSTSTTNTATIDGVAPGTTTVTATCSSPNCNIGVPPMYSYNVVTATVGGTSAAKIYAASTQSLTMVPILEATDSLGTAITLPALPNSMVAGASKVYLGADSGGVMVYDPTANTISRLSASGKVLAVNSNETALLISDPSNAGTYFFDISTNTLVLGSAGTSSSGVFTPDGAWTLFVSGQNLVRQGYNAATNYTSLSYTPNSIGLLAQGSLAFITSSSAHSVDVRSTCDQSDLQTLSAGNPSLISGLPNGKGAVAVDAPKIDVITTAQPSGSCPVVASSNLNSYDLQAGSFTPKQLFVSNDSSRAWVINDQSSLLSFDLVNLAPTAIPIAGGFQAISGGITPDSQQVYVGASDAKVHRIDVASLSDQEQFQPALKDANSNLVVPDLVALQPK